MRLRQGPLGYHFQSTCFNPPLRRRAQFCEPPLPPAPATQIGRPFRDCGSDRLAAVTGSLAGLTLVYSANLPQIEDLEHYRPSTITDLYDRKGRSSVRSRCSGAKWLATTVLHPSFARL